MTKQLDDLLPTQEDITNLTKNVVVVSELSALTSSEIQETDVLTFASPNVLSLNQNIQYRYFKDYLLSILLNDDLEINGKWEYSNTQNSKLCIETSAIVSGTDDTIVNKEYFEKNILSKIDELRNYIYTSQHVPSRIGDLIFSFTLSTENDVKERYGGQQWVQLSNVMIIGIGSSKANTITKYGDLKVGEMTITNSNTDPSGEANVSLNPSQIPNHTHKFKGSSTNINFKWTYRGSSQEKAATGIVSNADWGTSGQGHKAKMGSITGIKITGGTTIGSSKIYGNSLPLDSTIYNSSGQVFSSSPHNNIPPIIYTYVWKRIQ